MLLSSFIAGEGKELKDGLNCYAFDENNGCQLFAGIIFQI